MVSLDQRTNNYYLQVVGALVRQTVRKNEKKHAKMLMTLRMRQGDRNKSWTTKAHLFSHGRSRRIVLRRIELWMLSRGEHPTWRHDTILNGEQAEHNVVQCASALRVTLAVQFCIWRGVSAKASHVVSPCPFLNKPAHTHLRSWWSSHEFRSTPASLAIAFMEMDK